METRSVSRCVAIAAHGKRCQQSPFNGSPYCWHHTQSRKIWAPSRPRGSRGAASPERLSDPVEVPAEPERRAGVDRRATDDRRAGWAADHALGRLVLEVLGRERLTELLAFLDSADDGAFLLVREKGRLLSEGTSSQPAPRRRRSA